MKGVKEVVERGAGTAAGELTWKCAWKRASLERSEEQSTSLLKDSVIDTT